MHGKKINSFLFHLSREISIHIYVVEGTSSSLLNLHDSRIDFLLIEMMKGDKTLEWLCADCAKLFKV